MTVLLLLALGATGLDSLHYAGEYERVVELAPRFLADSAQTRADSVDVLRAEGFSLVALGRNRDAAAAFRRALALDPALRLDPERVSPKIRAVFDGVRREMPEPVRVERTDTVYARRPVPISIIIPGAGQFHNGQRAKGYALLGLGLASGAALVGSHVAYNGARDAYRAATEPGDIAERYDEANTWYRVRTISIGTTTVIWLLSLADAILNL